MTSCTKKYARKVRLYSVRTRNQITSLAMTANSKNSENSKHHQLSSKWIFLYPRHNWSDLLFLFILIVFYYYVLLDVYPPRNFIYILVFPVNSINNEIIGTILIHGQGPEKLSYPFLSKCIFWIRLCMLYTSAMKKWIVWKSDPRSNKYHFFFLSLLPEED